MEKLEKGEHEGRAAEERPGVTVHYVRHGPAEYRTQEYYDPKTADDLNVLGSRAEEFPEEERAGGKEAAVEEVRKTAKEIAEGVKPDEEVVIWASPTARTLETARIISDVLDEEGIAIRKKGSAREHGIRVFDVLGEVRNFSWHYFQPLVDGGKVRIGGRELELKKEETNPDGLGYTDYFMTDAAHKVPADVKAAWPEEYAKAIGEMERFADTAGRLVNVLQRILKLSDKKYKIIMVSHAGAADFLVRTFAPEAVEGIQPAEYVTVERNGGKMTVSRAGSIMEGDSAKDVIEAFDEKHGGQ